MPLYRIDAGRGFLPPEDPLQEMPQKFAWLDDLGATLPLLLVNGNARKIIAAVPPISTKSLHEREAQRAFLIYSFLASAYVWAPGQKPADRIPAGIAVALYELGKRLGQPPIMSYNPYCLQNWKRKDPCGLITLENLELLQHFSGVPDEAWFILDHVQIEAEAEPGLIAITRAQNAIIKNQPEWLGNDLDCMAQSLHTMRAALKRMPEGCSPDVYYHAVRPYLFGFKDILYEGVAPWKNKRVSLRGETGAQSSILPSLVAALGIVHEQTPLIKHTQVMHYYMQPLHRKFIKYIRHGPSIRAYVLRHSKDIPALKEAYNECIIALAAFRDQHKEWATIYINDRVTNPEGSGGTIFMPWLKLLIDETKAHLIP